MINRFLNGFIDYWVMLNYVFYKFYAKREKDAEVSGSVYAPAWVWFNLLSLFFLSDSILNCQMLLRTSSFNYKFWMVFSALLFVALNYFFLYRKDRWKDIFKQIDRERDTEEVSKRYRNTVIYIWGSVIFLIISVIIAGLFYGTISF